MVEPTDGDLIVRGCVERGFSVIDAASQDLVAGPLPLGRAVEAALARGPGDLWHQEEDDEGSPIGGPVLMLRRR